MTDANGGGWLELPTCDAARHGPACPAWCFGRATHYSDRAPVWLKDYTGESDADEYRSLTLARRGLLHELRRHYLRSGRRLRDDHVTISRRIGHRIIRADLEALREAGYIRTVASPALATSYHAASVEVEVEKKTPPKPPSRATTDNYICTHPDCNGQTIPYTTEARALGHITSIHFLDDHEARQYLGRSSRP